MSPINIFLALVVATAIAMAIWRAHRRRDRRNEELLEATNRLANVGGWELNLKTMELLWTAQTCRIHEVPVNYRPDLESAIEFYAPDAREVIQAAVQASIDNGSSWDLELPLITAKGRHRWVRAKGAAERENGESIRLHGAFQDVTELWEAEQALKHRLEFEAILARISSAFINLAAHAVVDEIDSSLGLLGNFLDADQISVAEFSADRSELQVKHHWSALAHHGRRSHAASVELARFPWARAKWLRGETIIVPRLSDLPAEAGAQQRRLQEDGVEAYISTPLVINGQVTGVVSLCSGHARPGWTEGFAHQFQLIAEVFANALTRKQDDEALQQSERKYRSLYQKTPAMLHSVDGSGTITSVSDYWLESTGYERGDVIGRPLLDFIAVSSLARAETVCLPRFAQAGLIKDEELQIVRKDGSLIDCLLSSVGERDRNGKPIRNLVVVIDITERKLAQEESRKHRDLLAHMTRLSTMGELVAGIAHEVKQPLYAITNFANAAGVTLRRFDSKTPPSAECLRELQDWNDGIRSASTRASQIIKRLREFARKDESRREAIPIRDVIADSVELVAFEARQCDVDVEIDIDDESAVVNADRIQCEQVMVNLLHNAYEALAESDHPRRVIVRTTTVDDMIEVQVIDNGPGIPAEQQRLLFEAFYTTKTTGMGMGLAISQTIVEDHGGRLWGNPNEWGGATFHLTLPCHNHARVTC